MNAKKSGYRVSGGGWGIYVMEIVERFVGGEKSKWVLELADGEER